jgi:hypothetical protein
MNKQFLAMSEVLLKNTKNSIDFNLLSILAHILIIKIISHLKNF